MMPPTVQAASTIQGDLRSARANPLVVNTPVPIMLATTNAVAVIKPSCRFGESFMSFSNFAEAHDVVVLEQLHLLDFFTTCGCDFFLHHFLSRAHVVHRPVGTLSGHALEIHHDHFTTGPQRLMDRSQRALRILEVMIHVA